MERIKLVSQEVAVSLSVSQSFSLCAPFTIPAKRPSSLEEMDVVLFLSKVRPRLCFLLHFPCVFWLCIHCSALMFVFDLLYELHVVRIAYCMYTFDQMNICCINICESK